MTLSTIQPQPLVRSASMPLRRPPSLSSMDDERTPPPIDASEVRFSLRQPNRLARLRTRPQASQSYRRYISGMPVSVSTSSSPHVNDSVLTRRSSGAAVLPLNRRSPSDSLEGSVSSPPETVPNACYEDHAHDPHRQLNLDSTKFPQTLHRLLEQAHREGFTDIISWQPHGRAFCVHSREEFVKTIIQEHFRMATLPSFYRQLCLYGFTRLFGGDDAYYHPYFLWGRPDLCGNIIRSRVKRLPPLAQTIPEPDFTSMSPCVRQQPVATRRKNIRYILRYKDHANDPYRLLDLDSTRFPDNLHRLLEKAHREGFTDIISWQPHGRAFCVHNREEFKNVFENHFSRRSKSKSFDEQLRLHGFFRPSLGVDTFYHPWFLCGRPDLCSSIRVINRAPPLRQIVPEPDFSTMPPCVGPSVARPQTRTAEAPVPVHASDNQVSGLASVVDEDVQTQVMASLSNDFQGGLSLSVAAADEVVQTQTAADMEPMHQLQTSESLAVAADDGVFQTQTVVDLTGMLFADQCCLETRMKTRLYNGRVVTLSDVAREGIVCGSLKEDVPDDVSEDVPDYMSEDAPEDVSSVSNNVFASLEDSSDELSPTDDQTSIALHRCTIQADQIRDLEDCMQVPHMLSLGPTNVGAELVLKDAASPDSNLSQWDMSAAINVERRVNGSLSFDSLGEEDSGEFEIVGEVLGAEEESEEWELVHA